MKKELDLQVMNTIFLAWALRDIRIMRFNQIAELSEIKKGTLHRVLHRLVKHGWINKIEVVADYVDELQVNSEIKKNIEERKGSWSDTNLIEYLRPITMKKHRFRPHIAYSLNSFPYMVGNNIIPVKDKRFWKKSSKALREYLKMYKKSNVIYFPIP